MSKRQRIAQSLVALGCVVVLAGSALHLMIAYPKVSAALIASNLAGDLKNALRAVFAIVGLTWITIAVVTLIATFAVSRISKPIVLFCGFALLFQVPIWVGAMGWFVGNEMFVMAGALIVGGGLFLRGPRSI